MKEPLDLQHALTYSQNQLQNFLLGLKQKESSLEEDGNFPYANAICGVEGLYEIAQSFLRLNALLLLPSREQEIQDVGNVTTKFMRLNKM